MDVCRGRIVKKVLLKGQRNIREYNHVINRYCNHSRFPLIFSQFHSDQPYCMSPRAAFAAFHAHSSFHHFGPATLYEFRTASLSSAKTVRLDSYSTIALLVSSVNI